MNLGNFLNNIATDDTTTEATDIRSFAFNTGLI